jgi:hypothetical protein
VSCEHDTGRANAAATNYGEIKKKLQQSIDKAKVKERLEIQFLRPEPGGRIEVVFKDKAWAQKVRKHTQ